MKLNKYFFILLLGVIFSLPGLTNVYGSQSETGTATTGQMDEDKLDTAKGVYARFCDFKNEAQGINKKTKIAVAPGKTHDICIDLLNKLDTPVDIHISFVDGGKDDKDNLYCLNEDQRGVFGQYVSGNDMVYSVPANSFKRITAQAKMPVSAAGTVYGCVSVYNDLVFKEILKKGGVSTLVRNAIPLELFVDTKVDVGLELVPVQSVEGSNLASDPVFVAKQANGTYQVAVGFKNVGGLDESVQVAGTVTDTLKKVTELAPQTKTVAPEAYSDVRYEIPALPWYKLRFNVDLTITHNAVSEFRTEFITEQLVAKKTITVSKTFFVFPWWLVGVLIVILLIIQLISRSRKHHQNEEKEMEELKKWKAEHAGPQQ